jgi:hypothetical protein
MEWFNLKKLMDVEGKEQFCFEVSNRFEALTQRWKLILTIRENIKISAKESIGYFEFRKQKPRFDEGCSKLLDQRKQAKLQWLQDPSEINGDNLNQQTFQE